MKNFQEITKNRLKNGQHFAFIQAFITLLQAAGFSASRIVTKLAELVSAFGEEDHWYMVARASEIVAQRAAADEKRDRFYGRLHRLIMAWAGSGMALLDAAATALEKPFKLYKINVSAQMDDETGALENLITDLSTPEMQAHITTINGTYLFEQMVDGQNQVKALRLEQGIEESQKVYGALSAARKRCDAIYDEMCDLIESFSKVADDTAPYETFINQWNGNVKLYQDMLDHKSGTSTSGSGSGQNGGQQSTDNGQQTGGGGTGEGGGETPDPGTGGGETPVNPGTDPVNPDPGTGGNDNPPGGEGQEDEN